jgi:hypothetical protein
MPETPVSGMLFIDNKARKKAKGFKTLFTETEDFPYYERLLNDSPSEPLGDLPTFSFYILKKVEKIFKCLNVPHGSFKPMYYNGGVGQTMSHISGFSLLVMPIRTIDGEGNEYFRPECFTGEIES